MTLHTTCSILRLLLQIRKKSLSQKTPTFNGGKSIRLTNLYSITIVNIYEEWIWEVSPNTEPHNFLATMETWKKDRLHKHTRGKTDAHTCIRTNARENRGVQVLKLSSHTMSTHVNLLKTYISVRGPSPGESGLTKIA